MRNTTLKLFLCLPILFSLVLLVTDAELWTAAPEHAYPLIPLTIMDSIALDAVFTDRNSVLRLTLFWRIFKTVLLLGDILTAPAFWLAYTEFAAYLFSLWAFTALVLSQLGITASATAYLHKRRRGSKVQA
ncbi:MAG: hypothetical protein QXM16_04805 [Nitrososphaerota archaeon]